MIKSVLHALPLHIISCLKLTHSICKSMERLVRYYSWSNTGNNKIHCIGWETLCKRKEECGLGLRDLSLFNKSLLAKQWWNLATQPNTLMATLFKDLYYPNSSFMNASLGHRPSPYWRDLIWGKSLLDKGLGWNFGDGSNINVRTDNWLKGSTSFKIIPAQNIPLDLVKAYDLIDRNSHNWNTPLLNQLHCPMDRERISNIPIPSFPAIDKLVWLPAADGEFSVKHAYWLGYYHQLFDCDKPITSSLDTGQK